MLQYVIQVCPTKAEGIVIGMDITDYRGAETNLDCSKSSLTLLLSIASIITMKPLIKNLSTEKYVKLIWNNAHYRLYLLSHLCLHGGDWLVRIAALISIERISKGSATALAIVVMCRTIPEILISPFGGLLADSYDRRKLMIRLDIISSFVVFGYVYAIRTESLYLFYLTTILRSLIAASYLPISHSIVPMLVTSNEDIKRAGIINGMVWSASMVIGGIVSGNVAANFGAETCFICDSVTYIVSAIMMSRIGGSYQIIPQGARKNETSESELAPSNLVMRKFIPARANLLGTLRSKFRVILSCWKERTGESSRSWCQMNFDLIRYLSSCGFGLLVFLKATGCFIWGPADVLNVSFAHVEDDPAESSRRMGRLYSAIGIGCILAPIVANTFIVDKKKPKTIQLSIICGMLFMASGWIGVGSHIASFDSICFFTILRCIGSSLIWIFSTVLLQQLSSPEFLGRILGLEFCLSRIFETLSVVATGRLKDRGLNDSSISFIAACISAFMFILWCTYHVRGNGANQKSMNKEDNSENTKGDLPESVC